MGKSYEINPDILVGMLQDHSKDDSVGGFPGCADSPEVRGVNQGFHKTNGAEINGQIADDPLVDQEIKWVLTRILSGESMDSIQNDPKYAHFKELTKSAVAAFIDQQANTEPDDELCTTGTNGENPAINTLEVNGERRYEGVHRGGAEVDVGNRSRRALTKRKVIAGVLTAGVIIPSAVFVAGFTAGRVKAVEDCGSGSLLAIGPCALGKQADTAINEKFPEVYDVVKILGNVVDGLVDKEEG